MVTLNFHRNPQTRDLGLPPTAANPQIPFDRLGGKFSAPWARFASTQLLLKGIWLALPRPIRVHDGRVVL